MAELTQSITVSGQRPIELHSCDLVRRPAETTWERGRGVSAETEPDTSAAPPDRADALRALSEAVGHTFTNLDLLELATRHRSWCAEHDGVESNERLEFLGDAVLGLIVTDHLYLGDPEVAEGVLARRRAELVNSRALAELAVAVGLGDAIRLGRGEHSTGGRTKPSILADAMEAVFGAVYLDGGLAAARRVILGLSEEMIAHVCSGAEGTDHKSLLQEAVARRFETTPRYEIYDTGPDHHKWFEATVWVDETAVGRGAGRSKKQAEQAAAREAWMAMNEAVDSRSENGVGDA